jgi:hypothetical protein
VLALYLPRNQDIYDAWHPKSAPSPDAITDEERL